MIKFTVNNYYYGLDGNGDLNAILVCERSGTPLVLAATADTSHLFAVGVNIVDSIEHLTFGGVEFSAARRIPFEFASAGGTAYATVNGCEIVTIEDNADEISRHAGLFAAIFGTNSPSILARIKVALLCA